MLILKLQQLLLNHLFKCSRTLLVRVVNHVSGLTGTLDNQINVDNSSDGDKAGTLVQLIFAWNSNVTLSATNFGDTVGYLNWIFYFSGWFL